MRTIYVDCNNHVHTQYVAGYEKYDTEAFDGMADPVIACYRYFPANGERVERIQAWKSSAEIHYTELEYANEQLPIVTAQNAELMEAMAQLVEEIYESDMGFLE